MFYLLERDISTGEFVTNFTMYDTSPEALVNRLWPDGLYYSVMDGHEVAYDVPCYHFYRHINTGKEVGIIYSVF